jgi:hypothetical protein
MSRLAIPVDGQRLWATGDVKLSVEVVLALRDGTGNFVTKRFKVDTGTEITTFSAHNARKLGLFLPTNPAAIRHEQTGLEVRSGMLAFRVVGMDQTLYAVPCLFLGDPNTSPGPNTPTAMLPRNLLQPLALLDVLKFSTEKDPGSVGAPYGELIIEKK